MTPKKKARKAPAKKPSPPAPMTVVRLDVDSYKRLRAAHVEPTPTGLVLVRGRNAQGKSTLIESMLDALGAEKSALPITEGEHGAEVTVDLGQLVIKKRWTRDDSGAAKASLTVEAADGSKIKGPASVLTELRSHFADPVAFLDLKAADQVKTILAVTGLDEELDALELVAEGQFERRRDLGRDADRLGKALIEISTEVEGLPAPPDEGSIEDLTAELTAAKDVNARIAGIAHTKTAVAGRGKQDAARLELLKAEVEKLEASIADARELWDTAHAESKELTEIDIAPITEKLSAFEDVAKHAARRELLDSTRAQAEEAAALHAKVGESLEETRQAISELLAGADFPDPAMTYDAGTKTLKLNEIPFAQASQAERLKAAASVAMAGDPAIRVMFAREGSLLDEESRIYLAELAEASGFQLWLEVVDSEAEGSGVWIEDGEAFQA
tara:strand:- start:3178 stop:4506 length:1329 start_codon:yes stop_codon:yes gene_type:complete